MNEEKYVRIAAITGNKHKHTKKKNNEQIANINKSIVL